MITRLEKDQSELQNSVECMYFKRELVENCKKMKTTLRTEESFPRPATKSVTVQSVKESSPRMKISWDRPKVFPFSENYS